MDPPEIELLHKAFPNGASEAFLVRASNGRSYAAKFREKAQHNERGLGREVLAGVLASILGVSVPAAELIMLTQDFVDNEPNLKFRDGSRPRPGLASGSSFVPHMNEPPFDHSARLALCPASDAAGIVVFNTWTGVSDRHWDNYAFFWNESAVRLASIDYADAFMKSPGSALTVVDQQDIRDVAMANADLVTAALDRLDQLTDARIDDAVALIPDELIPVGDKTSIQEFLKIGRGSVRALVGGSAP